jgi:hypothetical protein
MKTFIEIKETICKLFHVNTVDEADDIVLIESNDEGHNNSLIIKNDELKLAYDAYSAMKVEQLQLFSSSYFEVAVLIEWFPQRSGDDKWLEDDTNKIAYQLGNPSTEYCIMMMDYLNFETFPKNRVSRNAAFFLSRLRNRIGHVDVNFDLTSILSRVFRVQTLRIKSETGCPIASFRNYARAYEYLYMYKTRWSLVEVSELENILIDESGGIARSSEIDEPPRRIVNSEILEYYTMAIEARDPFTKYISFYHVVEYFFDEVYRRKIIVEMRDRITDPSFSYKSDKSIYELAKFANKKMKNDDKNGRGNEFESLKYVLNEYVPIESLKDGLDELNSTLVQYYATKNVSFAGTNNKIAWNDSVGVYTTVARRVYETRNALVHTKSDQSQKQYKPQKHKELLKREIPLIQVIAEKVIHSTSTVL